MMSIVITLLGVAIFICLIGVLISHVRLIELSRNRPDIVARAGIGEIDWWWSCLRGVFCLGFTRLGQGLPVGTRMAFRLAISTYVLVFITVVLLAVQKSGGG
jgi:hypothetical protein